MARIKHTPTKYSSSSLDYKTIIKYARLLQTLIISLEVDTIDDKQSLDNNDIKTKIINPQITNNSSLNKPSIKRRGRPRTKNKDNDDDKQIIIKKEDEPPINHYDDNVKVDYSGILNYINYLGITELMNNGDIELK